MPILLYILTDIWTKSSIPVPRFNNWFDSLRTTTCSGNGI